jgi:hypothetical protein
MGGKGINEDGITLLLHFVAFKLWRRHRIPEEEKKKRTNEKHEGKQFYQSTQGHLQFSNPKSCVLCFCGACIDYCL